MISDFRSQLFHAVGIDTEPIDRFRNLDLPHGATSFYKRVFTENELSACDSYDDPAPHLAVRYCAKEAVIKAFDGVIDFADPAEIEIVNDTHGRPSVIIHRTDFEKDRFIIAVSLTHSQDTAIAFVSVIGN